MASQPIVPFAYQQPKPAVRIAFSADTVNAAVAELPASTREQTLDDLAFTGATERVIETARQLLSPRMFTAFLRWGETASHFSTKYDSDEEGEARCGIAGEAATALANVPVVNIHDLLLKSHLLAQETGDNAAFDVVGRYLNKEGRNADAMLRAVSFEQVSFSPLLDILNDLCERAWAASGQRTSGMDKEIGSAITDAFRRARATALVSRNNDVPANIEAAGYAPSMRGVLILWEERYTRFQEDWQERLTYERDVYDPATHDMPDVVQARFDDLVGLEGDSFERLLRTPAPGPSELAVKLKLIAEREDEWRLAEREGILDEITADARRFGHHGPHLQADASILEEFSQRRRETETNHDVDLNDTEHRAYLDRIDVHEGAIAGTPANTIEGVIAKLRVAFFHFVGMDWSDRAIMDPAHPKFVDGLSKADPYTKLLWGAVEDLARIGGVNLSEQGR